MKPNATCDQRRPGYPGGLDHFGITVDGTVTMVLAPYKISDYLGTEHKRPGFDHVGFEVEDLQAFKDDVELLAKDDPEYLAPKPANVESEYQVIMDLLRSCRYGKYQMCDPEGNLVDIAVV